MCTLQSTQLEATDDTGAGTPQYYPSAGIPMGCFPFCGPSINFTQGIAAVKFVGLKRGRKVRIACRIYAANVASSLKHRTGVSVFSLHVES